MPSIGCGPGGRAGEHRRPGRLDRDRAEAGPPRAERAGHAGDAPAAPHAGHQDVDAAVRVGPDLLGRGAPVGVGVGRVGELPGQEGARGGGGDALGRGDGPGHALVARREDDLGAVGPHAAPPLEAHGLGHRDDAAVAAGGADHGQRHAGVAGGRLDDHAPPGRDEAAALGGLDHAEHRPVLDAAPRVHRLQLDQDVRRDLARHPPQPHDRRGADQVGDGVDDAPPGPGAQLDHVPSLVTAPPAQISRVYLSDK